VTTVPQVELPPEIAGLVDRLAASRGVVAVVLGGSRAWGDADESSDWDLGLYYRSTVDTSALATYGEVHPPGSWGRIMNGGAWLEVGGHRVDVLLRDLDVVEHWTAQAGAGRYEVDALLGYAAGVPTYSLTAEVAGAEVLRGVLDVPADFPPALRDAGGPRWRFHRDFSLRYAGAHAARGNPVGALAQCGRAVLEEAHARRCDRMSWALNEKRLLDGCDLTGAVALMTPPIEHDLGGLVEALAAALAGAAGVPSAH
jgi:hypothetical protein